jgi:hypothetical protein
MRGARPTIVGCVALALFCACTLTTSLDGFSEPVDPSTEGGSPDGPGFIAPDGSTPGDSAVALGTATTIAQVGASSKSTGRPMQGHLLWAEHSARWVFFAFDSAAQRRLVTKTSADFTTWADGPSLDLPYDHQNEGRNLAVATALLAERDVFHLGLGLRADNNDRRHFWVRGTMTGDTLALGGATEITTTNEVDNRLDPDGAAVGITKDGYVTLFTGWSKGLDSSSPNSGTGNQYAFRSSITDVGSTFGASWSKAYIKTVPIICNARGALAIGSSDFISFFEKGDEDPIPTNLSWTRGSTSWSNPSDVFGSKRSFDANDWSAVRVSDTDVHAVRLRQDGNLDHRRWNGAMWSDGGAIPAETIGTGTGVALVTGKTPSSVVLFAIGAGGAVRFATWNGAAWSTWNTAVAGGPARTAIVGTSSTTHAAVAWTETTGGGNSVAGIVVR